MKVLRLNRVIWGHKKEQGHEIIGCVVAHINDIFLSQHWFSVVAWKSILPRSWSVRHCTNPEQKMQASLQSKTVWFWQELFSKSLQVLTCSALHNALFHIVISVEQLMEKPYWIRANRSDLNPLKVSRACAIDSFFPGFALVLCLVSIWLLF